MDGPMPQARAVESSSVSTGSAIATPSDPEEGSIERPSQRSPLHHVPRRRPANRRNPRRSHRVDQLFEAAPRPAIAASSSTSGSAAS